MNYRDPDTQMTPPPEVGEAPARILVIDDSLFGRKKLVKAVARLGHRPDAAEDGVSGLEMLRSGGFDAVLLDIVMPRLDGFDVLRAMKADPDLTDVPVIVVSSLDDETESVVRAIHLGAVDFLPKSFDPVILEARLGASLARKRFRDHERDYFRAVERLTRAAELVEHGSIGADTVQVDDVAERNDALGRLAAVFRGMVSEIYERELRLKRTIRMLQGSLLVIALGILWGLMPALSRLAAGTGAEPLALVVQINLVAALLCLGSAALRRRLPRLGRGEIGYFLTWAALNGIIQKIAIVELAGHLEATMLSLIVTVQGFVVFAIAAVTRVERTTPRRLAGLGVGLVGVTAMLFTRLAGADMGQIVLLAVALLIPVSIAVEGILMAARQPTHIDFTAAFGLMMALSTAVLVPAAWLSGAFSDLAPWEPGRIEMLTLAMGAATAVGGVIGCHLVQVAGALFASQSAYVKTVAGIMWGSLLLDERLSALTWGSIALILVGLYLVGPEMRDATVRLNRSFTARRKPRE